MHSRLKGIRPRLLNVRRRASALAVAIIAMFTLTACWGDKTFYSASDSQTCLFDGAKDKGQVLKNTIPPGAPSVKAKDYDIAVQIPASNRFYAASTDSAVRDTLNDKYYAGNAKGPLAIQIQGQVKFRFNLSKACDWYVKSGKRNADSSGDLGFNARGTNAQASAGWFHYLAENFRGAAEQAAIVVSPSYTWQQLKYNYDLQANPTTGILDPGVQPGVRAVTDFNVKLGLEFTRQLESSIGGNYFCGTQTTDLITGARLTEACPPIMFYASSIDPEDPKLVTNQAALAVATEAFSQDAARARLLEQSKAATLAAEAAQQAINAAKAETAKTAATLDPEVQKCLVLAAAGDDCKGNRFPTYVGTPPK